MMFWLVLLAILLSILALFFILTWSILRLKDGKQGTRRYFGLYKSEPAIYKYIARPLQGTEFQQEMPKLESTPTKIQPGPANLDLRLFAVWGKPSTVDEQNVNNGSPTELCQTPLVSNYESDKKKDLTWMTNARRTLEESYRQTFIPKTDNVAPVMAIQEPEASVLTEAENLELSFSIFYDAPTKDLHVTVVSASGFHLGDITRRARYFRVNARVEPWETKWRETRSTRGETEASFNETFIVSGLVHHKLRECRIHFVLIGLEEYKNCWKVIGEVTQSLIECRANQLMKVTKKLS